MCEYFDESIPILKRENASVRAIKNESGKLPARPKPFHNRKVFCFYELKVFSCLDYFLIWLFLRTDFGM
jgi:hypothetical protein